MNKDVTTGLGFVLLTILFTVYGQLIIKWQVLKAGAIPSGLSEKLLYFVDLFKSVWVLSGFFAAFLASIAWMAAMTKLPLSFAYPFMSLSFVVVIFLSSLIFKEVITWQILLGIMLIVLGLITIGVGQ